MCRGLVSGAQIKKKRDSESGAQIVCKRVYACVLSGSVDAFLSAG